MLIKGKESCPYCLSRDNVKNGTYVLKDGRKRQRYVCRFEPCGSRWSEK